MNRLFAFLSYIVLAFALHCASGCGSDGHTDPTNAVADGAAGAAGSTDAGSEGSTGGAGGGAPADGSAGVGGAPADGSAGNGGALSGPFAYFANEPLTVDIATGSVGTTTLTLALTEALPTPCTIDIAASGSATDIDSPAHGDSPVLGSYYSLSANSVTFAPGELTKEVTLTTRYRKLLGLHVPFYEVGLKLTLLPAASNTDDLKIHPDKGVYEVRLLDDVTTVVKNIADYAAYADGSGDWTKAFQTAIDDIKKTIDPQTQTGIVYVPNGVYVVGGPVYSWPGVTLLGESRTGVTIQRPTKAFYTAKGISDNNIPKLFSYQTYGWNGKDDSTWGCFRNLTFDGNQPSFEPIKPYTKHEFSHLLYFHVRNSDTLRGKARVFIENCHFRHSTTSDWSGVHNVVIHEYNTYHEKGVEGKGTCGFVGGNSFVTIKKSHFNRPFDLEMNCDSDGFGIGGHYGDGRQEAKVADSYLKAVQYAACKTDKTDAKQVLDVSNTTIEDFSSYSPSGDVKLTNCTLNPKAYGSTGNTLIRRAKSFLAKGCTINIGAPKAGSAGFYLWFEPVHAAPPKWTFQDCTFNASSKTYPGPVYGIYEPNYHEKGSGTLVVDGCSFLGSFDYAYRCEAGASARFKDCTVTGADTVFGVKGFETTKYVNWLDLSVENMKSNAPTYMYVHGATSTGTNRVRHVKNSGAPTTVLAKSASEIVADGSAITKYVTDFSGQSGRKITGSGAPPTTGLKGDTYSNGVDSWLCTATGYRLKNGTGTEAATWTKQ